MNLLTSILQAVLLPLVAPLVEFATSTSGHVEPREGLALGWLGSVVAGLAVVFSTAERTQAGPCYGIPEGSRGSYTTSDPCEWRDHKPFRYWVDHYYHYREDKGCVYLYATCP